MSLRPMTVLMPFYTPFYAPLAAGAALGHFREEGLDVRWQPAAAFGKSAVEALLDGSIEITLSGLMRSFDWPTATAVSFRTSQRSAAGTGSFSSGASRGPDSAGRTSP